MFVQLKQAFNGKAVGERIDVSESDSKILLSAGIAEAVQGDPLGDVIQKQVGAMLESLTKGLNDTIDATIKQFAHNQTKSRKNAVPAIFGDGNNGDPKKTFGNFLIAVRTNDTKTLEEMGSYHVSSTKAALAGATGNYGGFTVPTEFLPRLLAVAAEQSIVESRATIVPMGAETIDVPALDVTTAPTAGNTAFFAGLTATWSKEVATINETEPAFKSISLTANELTGYTLASNTLLSNSAIGLEAILVALFGGAIGWYKDYAFLRGNGAGKPLGVLNANALITTTRSGATAFTLADAAGMLGRLLPGWNTTNTAWVIHPTVLVKLLTMGGNTGSSANAIFINNAHEKPQMQLFGIPVVVSEKLVAVGTVGDVLLVDFKHYLVGQRADVEIAYSEHFKFQNNQSAWRFVARCDGQPWLRSAITLADASSTLSPYVAVGAP